MINRTLAYILYPLTVPIFFADYWQRDILLIKRNTPFFYHDLLPNHEDLFASDDAECHGFKNGASHKQKLNLGNGHDGCCGTEFSFVKNTIETQCASCLDVLEDIQKQTLFRCQMNLYKSPPYSQAFPTHFDWMDVLIIQLKGSKKWDLYRPLVRQPRKDMRFPVHNMHDISNMSSNHLVPIQSIVLEQGDFLYLPSGIIHQVTTLMESSVHITINVETTIFGSWESLWKEWIMRTMGKCVVCSPTLLPMEQPSYHSSLHGLQQHLCQEVVLMNANWDDGTETLRWGHVLILVLRYVATKHSELREPACFLYASQEMNYTSLLLEHVHLISTRHRLDDIQKHEEYYTRIFSPELQRHLSKFLKVYTLHISNSLVERNDDNLEKLLRFVQDVVLQHSSEIKKEMLRFMEEDVREIQEMKRSKFVSTKKEM